MVKHCMHGKGRGGGVGKRMLCTDLGHMVSTHLAGRLQPHRGQRKGRGRMGEGGGGTQIEKWVA